jgi:hypothetical protein
MLWFRTFARVLTFLLFMIATTVRTPPLSVHVGLAEDHAQHICAVF